MVIFQQQTVCLPEGIWRVRSLLLVPNGSNVLLCCFCSSSLTMAGSQKTRGYGCHVTRWSHTNSMKRAYVQIRIDTNNNKLTNHIIDKTHILYIYILKLIKAEIPILHTKQHFCILLNGQMLQKIINILCSPATYSQLNHQILLSLKIRLIYPLFHHFLQYFGGRQGYENLSKKTGVFGPSSAPPGLQTLDVWTPTLPRSLSSAWVGRWKREAVGHNNQGYNLI